MQGASFLQAVFRGGPTSTAAGEVAVWYLKKASPGQTLVQSQEPRKLALALLRKRIFSLLAPLSRSNFRALASCPGTARALRLVALQPVAARALMMGQCTEDTTEEEEMSNVGEPSTVTLVADNCCGLQGSGLCQAPHCC